MIFAPSRVCCLTMSNSSGVSAVGLVRMSSGMRSLPISCRLEAMQTVSISSGPMGQRSVRYSRRCSSSPVMRLTFVMCVPLSPLRNSTA